MEENVSLVPPLKSLERTRAFVLPVISVLNQLQQEQQQVQLVSYAPLELMLMHLVLVLLALLVNSPGMQDHLPVNLALVVMN